MSEQILDNTSVFVGRTGEIRQIKQALDSMLKTKKLHLLMVEGEPGTGKSALIQEALEQISKEHPQLIISQSPCTQESQDTPFHPFRSLIYKDSFWKGLNKDYREIAEVMLELSSVWIDTQLLNGMPYASSLAIALKHLIKQPDKKETEEIDIFKRYKNFLEKRLRGNKALVLFLDDVQWIDLSSGKLLRYLKKELQNLPVLVITACRPKEFSNNQGIFKTINFLFDGSRACRINLIEGIDVFEYVDKCFSPNNISKGFLQKLQDVTKGHPFAVVETLNLLRTEEILCELKIGDKKTWHLRTENFEPPPLLNELIYARLLDVAEEDRLLLEVASVEGEYFTFEVIAQALDETPTVLIQRLRRLRRNWMLIHEVGVDGEFHIYRFTHKLYQNYIYQELDNTERDYYHQSIGLAMEEVYQKDKTGVCMQLERHFSACRRKDKAIQYGVMSAKQAHKSCSWQEAILYSQKVLKSCDTPEDQLAFNPLRCDAAVTWADSAYRMEKIRPVLPILEALTKEFDTDETRDLQARILIEKANLYYVLDREKALPIAYEAVAAAEKTGKPELIYTAKGYLSDVLIDNENKYVEGKKILEELLVLSEQLPDDEKIAETKAALAWCLSDLGEYELTYKYAQEAVETVQKPGFTNWVVKAFSYRVAGLGAMVMGDFQRAREYTQQALDIYRENKDAAKEPWLLYEIGQFLQIGHDFEQAEPYFRQALEKANELDDDETKIWVFTSWADMEIDRGNLALAAQFLEQIKALLEKLHGNSTAQDDQEYLTCLAKLYFYQQRYDESWDLMEKVHTQLDEEAERSTQAYEVKYWKGKILQAKKQYKEAREQLISAVEMAEKFNDSIWKAQAYEGLGDLYIELEEPIKARYFYKKSLQVLRARFTRSRIDDALESKFCANEEILKGKWMQPDNQIIPLSREYTCKHAPITITFVNQNIFTHRYFTNCMGCDFCKDICCQYGVDIDIENVERLKQNAEALKPYVRYPVDQWFRAEFERDEEFPGNYYTRTLVKDGACVFRNQLGRGCGIHRMCLDQGRDYHELKPLVCSLFPITFDYDSLLVSTELEDGSLICANTGPSAYRGNRNELIFYFGPELAAELDEIEKQVLAKIAAA